VGSGQRHASATISEQLMDRRLGGYDNQEKNPYTFMEWNTWHPAKYSATFLKKLSMKLTGKENDK
jgi:hypothetical protein